MVKNGHGQKWSKNGQNGLMVKNGLKMVKNGLTMV